MPWLVWGIVASGLSAAYWWKKMHPGASLNPAPKAKTAEELLREQQEEARRAQG